MEIISGYLIRQVAETNKDAYVKEVLDLFHEAKRRSSPAYVGNHYYYSRSEGLSSISYGTRKYYVRTSETSSSGLLQIERNTRYLYRYCRYKRNVYLGTDLITNGIWDASESANGYYMTPVLQVKCTQVSGQGEDVIHDWTVATESQGGRRDGNNRYFTGSTVDSQWIAGEGATIDHLTYQAGTELPLDEVKQAVYATNVPHFESRSQSIEFISNAADYFDGSMTEEQFDNFMAQYLVLP